MSDTKKVVLGTVLALAVLFSAIICWKSINVVEKGEYGVVASFGSVEDNVLMPGLNFVWPWKKVYRIPSVIQKDEEEAATPTKEGMTCDIKSILMWKIDPKKVVEIVKEYGHEGFEDRLVHPYFRGAIRDVTVQFDSESLYTQDRAKVELMMLDKVTKVLDKHGIITESVTLTNLKLPESVKQRIEAKVSAEQDVKRMEFVLKQKELEGKAKIVEAEAIAKSQQIIKKDLDIHYLYYLWIQALKEKDNNLIYVPIGQDGLPLFRHATPK